jgi:hypothetical protein
MYDHSSVFIVTVLLLGLILVVEIGHLVGLRYMPQSTDAVKSQVNTIQGSLLGVLALLLGFTFSLALQRYDTRSQAVVAEANAIGTAMLRAELLPPSVRVETQQVFRQYLQQRVAAAEISLDRHDERQAALEQSNATLDQLWAYARQAASADPNPVNSGLFIQALNDVIDTYGLRDAALNRHVPELVLFLLFGTFAMAAGLVGFSSGLSGKRIFFPTYVLIVLIALLVFLIIDLDRPRRGLIAVSQQSLIDLNVKANMTAIVE